MKTLTAREILHLQYQDSKNFMTPHVITRGKLSRNIAYELASGSGIEHKPIYGVSVVEVVDAEMGLTKLRQDLGGLFYDLDSAYEHIKDVKYSLKEQA